jgi:micrococcal nuclease
LLTFALNAHADEFTCNVASTTDGDTFRCDDDTRVRIHGIDAPEMDTAEGPASRDALQALIEGRTLACEQNGTSYNRVVATCFLDDQDIAAMMVQQVMARDCPRYSGGAYAELETDESDLLPIGAFCSP